jgi:cyclophilin family peptidyl-prolyl cis-trans isomerase
MRRPGLLALAVALLVVLAAGCGSSKKSAASTTSTTSTAAATSTTAATTTAAAPKKNGCTVITSPPALPQKKQSKPKQQLDPKKTYLVTMQTNCGSFTFEIDQKQSPNDAASFVALVQHGFFNGTIFHRIVPGFVIQGGDPTGTGTGGPGYTTVDKPPANAAYTHGVVAMAKTQTDPAGTAGSQFFIVTVPDAQLSPDYAIIGKVVKGLAVVDHIGTLGDVNTQQPTMIVEIQRATVKTS